MIVTRRSRRRPEYLKVDNEIMNITSNFVYLSCCLSENNKLEETKRHISLANKTYFSLLPIMRSRDVH